MRGERKPLLPLKMDIGPLKERLPFTRLTGHSWELHMHMHNNRGWYTVPIDVKTYSFQSYRYIYILLVINKKIWSIIIVIKQFWSIIIKLKQIKDEFSPIIPLLLKLNTTQHMNQHSRYPPEPSNNSESSLYALSPRMSLANLISFGMTVTRPPWTEHNWVSSNIPTR